MSGVNKLIIIGHLGRDAEMAYTQGGAALCKFTVAVTEKWKDKDHKPQERTEWFRCQLWGKRGEAVAKYLEKGTRVYVEGRVQSRKYTGKDDVERTITEINVNDVQLLGGGGKRGESSGGGRRDDKSDYDSGGDGAGREGSFGYDFGDDDIPF